MSNKEKLIHLCLEVRDGEREYHCHNVHSIPLEKTLEEFSNDYAKSFYSSEAYEEDGGYYHFGGEVHVSVHSYKEITQEEFDVLKRFLP